MKKTTVTKINLNQQQLKNITGGKKTNPWVCIAGTVGGAGLGGLAGAAVGAMPIGFYSGALSGMAAYCH